MYRLWQSHLRDIGSVRSVCQVMFRGEWGFIFLSFLWLFGSVSSFFPYQIESLCGLLDNMTGPSQRQPRMGQHNPVQHNPVHHNPAQHNHVQHNPAQQNPVQHNPQHLPQSYQAATPQMPAATPRLVPQGQVSPERYFTQQTPTSPETVRSTPPPPPPPSQSVGGTSATQDLAAPSEARERLQVCARGGAVDKRRCNLLEQEHAEKLTELLSQGEGLWIAQQALQLHEQKQPRGELQEPEPDQQPQPRQAQRAKKAKNTSDRRPRRVSPAGKQARCASPPPVLSSLYHFIRPRVNSPESPPMRHGGNVVNSEVSASPVTSPQSKAAPQQTGSRRAPVQQQQGQMHYQQTHQQSTPQQQPSQQQPARRDAAQSFRPLAKTNNASAANAPAQPPQERGRIMQQVHERLAYLSKQIGADGTDPTLATVDKGQRTVSPQGKRASSNSRNGVLRVAEYASSDQLKRVQRFRDRQGRSIGARNRV